MNSTSVGNGTININMLSIFSTYHVVLYVFIKYIFFHNVIHIESIPTTQLKKNNNLFVYKYITLKENRTLKEEKLRSP